MIDSFTFTEVGIRAALVTVFAVAVAGKAGPAARREFSSAVTELAPRTPEGMVRWVAWGVIGIETVVVAALLVPGTATATTGFVMAAILLTGFTLAVAGAIRRGSTSGCHCFGRSARPVSGVEVGRNLLLLCLCGIGIADAVIRHSHPHGEGMWVAALAGVILGAAATASDALIDLARAPELPSPTTFRSRLDQESVR